MYKCIWTCTCIGTSMDLLHNYPVDMHKGWSSWFCRHCRGHKIPKSVYANNYKHKIFHILGFFMTYMYLQVVSYNHYQKIVWKLTISINMVAWPTGVKESVPKSWRGIKFCGLAVCLATAKLKSTNISYLHIRIWQSLTEPPNLNPPIFLHWRFGTQLQNLIPTIFPAIQHFCWPS